MQTLAAFYQSVDPAGGYVQLAAIADPVLTVNSPRIQVPTLNDIIAIAAGVETTVVPSARLVAPSLLTMWREQISPVNGAAAAAVVPLSPHRIMDLRDDPIVLVPSEQLTAEINSNPAAAQLQWVLIWFADGKPTPVSGRIITARATVANALTAGAWSLNTLTFDEQLPRGRYSIVGLRGVSTSMVACRLVIPGYGWRPGCLGSLLVTDIANDMFRYGNMGELGQFEDVDNLQVETLANAADTAAAQIYWVDLLQLRAGPA